MVVRPLAGTELRDGFNALARFVDLSVGRVESAQTRKERERMGHGCLPLTRPGVGFHTRVGDKTSTLRVRWEKTERKSERMRGLPATDPHGDVDDTQ